MDADRLPAAEPSSRSAGGGRDARRERQRSSRRVQFHFGVGSWDRRELEALDRGMIEHVPRFRRDVLARLPIVGLGERLAAIRRFDAGQIGPPSPWAKRRHLLGLLRDHGLDVFVESGTYLGDTLAYIHPHVRHAISVELEPDLFEAARRRFDSEPKVELHQGDAVNLIPGLIDALAEPALVWLDGHFSGPTTAQGAEVEPAPTILESLGNVNVVAGTIVVVDDLRLFGRDAGFPSLERLVASATIGLPNARLVVGMDSLIVVT